MIKYKLFKDGKGVVADRMPKKFKANVTLNFGEDTVGCTLILKNASGNVSYRELKSGRATIPIELLDGDISVIVADLSNSDKRYQCEGLVCKKEDGFTWIMPEGLNLPLEISECKKAVEDLRKEFRGLYELVLQLKADYEGYDLI